MTSERFDTLTVYYQARKQLWKADEARDALVEKLKNREAEVANLEHKLRTEREKSAKWEHLYREERDKGITAHAPGVSFVDALFMYKSECDRNEALMQKNKALESDINEANARVQALEAQLTKATESEAKLQEEVAAQKHTLQIALDDALKLTSEFEQRSQQVLHEQKAHARLQQENVGLQRRCDNALDKALATTEKANELRGKLTKEAADHAADLKKLAAASAQEKNLGDELARERAKLSQLEASWKAQYEELYEEFSGACAKSYELESELKDLRLKIMPKPARCCDCQYEPDRNYDFRGISDAGKSFIRGGARYIRPVGSMRHALAVDERYDDKEWLNDGTGGWPVAYHGTSRESAAAIIRNGFHLSKGKRFNFGRGIYCTPDPATAKAYATACIDGNTRWKCVLQVRVKPGAYKVAKRTDSNDGEYWLVADPAHIRPYAVCVYDV